MSEAWRMFGSYDEEHDYWCAIGRRHYVLAHGGPPPQPVEVTEDHAGTHRGWIGTGEHEPRMILRAEIFEIQFPYGSHAEVERGSGRVVQLSIRKTP